MKYGRWRGTRLVAITTEEALDLSYRRTFILEYSPSDCIVWTDRRRLKRQRRRFRAEWKAAEAAL